MWNGGIWNNGKRRFIFKHANEGKSAHIPPFFTPFSLFLGVVLFLEKQACGRKSNSGVPLALLLSANTTADCSGVRIPSSTVIHHL